MGIIKIVLGGIGLFLFAFGLMYLSNSSKRQSVSHIREGVFLGNHKNIYYSFFGHMFLAIGTMMAASFFLDLNDPLLYLLTLFLVLIGYLRFLSSITGYDYKIITTVLPQINLIKAFKDDIFFRVFVLIEFNLTVISLGMLVFQKIVEII